jgi:phosphatidylserine decarboxylase
MPALGASEVESDASSGSRAPRLGIGGRALWVLLYLLPKNSISRLAGWFASLRLPGPLQAMQIRLFARATGIELDEAAQPVEAYPSLQAFFTRSLRDGARPVAGDSKSLTSPCDGTWGAAGPIDGGTLLQVKGRTYRVRDLLGDVDAADVYEGGYFATLYLSPRDYHRLHTPTAGHIRRVAYHPGRLWPVNSIGLLGIDGLFATNERICAYLEPDGAVDPGGAYEVVGAVDSALVPCAIAMVAVGATMVGSVKLTFDDMTTNCGGASVQRDFRKAAPHFDRCVEWGRFEFGSTIVLLIPPESFELDPRPPGTPLRLGEVIGHRIR